jgi:hypothetical protein
VTTLTAAVRLVLTRLDALIPRGAGGDAGQLQLGGEAATPSARPAAVVVGISNGVLS